MNKAQPDTLYQTMEKWLSAYRSLNNCDENKAMDAFDDLSDSIRAAGKGETATAFHSEVIASLKAMAPKKDDVSWTSPPVIGGRRAGDIEASGNLPKHVGGPLLETGVDPLGFVNGSMDVMGIAKQSRRLHEVMDIVRPLVAPEPDALEKADTIMADLNAQTTAGLGKAAHKLINLEESIQNEIDYLKKMISQCKKLGEPSKEHPLYESYVLRVNRLAMLEELQNRQQARTGRVLSLKGKN